MNPKVDEFLEKVMQWRLELEALRSIVLECGLTEELKWRQPCYTWKDANILLLGNFKNFCSLSFFKGVLLLDTHNILSLPGENSQSAKFAKFTNVDDILLAKEVLKSYIYEAIEVEKAGLKIELKKPADLVLVEELVSKLESNPALASAFEALTPGRQRAYNLHFAAAKQSKTRTSRIDNSIDRILSGKGINDCTCGLSKRMPNCDGSHKLLRK